MNEEYKKQIKDQLYHAADVQYECICKALGMIQSVDPTLTPEQQDQALHNALDATMKSLVSMTEAQGKVLDENISNPEFIKEVIERVRAEQL